MFEPEFTDVAEIGRGPYSTNYRAHSAGRFGDVVLKHFTGRLAEPAAVTGFAQEYATLAALSFSPHLVPVYGTGRTPDERPYVIMPYYRLGSLLDVVRSGHRPSLAETLYVAGAVGSALSLAHGRGLLHGRIKPQNLLLGEHGHVAVSDFGRHRPITAAGATNLMSTHAFSAPEVVRTRPAEARWEILDARSDVYSLAATLYWLLTGRPPHPMIAGESGFRQVQRIVDDPAEPLPAGLPAPVIAVIHAALARTPSDRPPSMLAFRRALAEAAGHAGIQPVAALRIQTPPAASGPTPSDPTATSSRWLRRRPTSVAVIGVSTLAAMAIALGLASARPRPTAPDPPPVRPASGPAQAGPTVTAWARTPPAAPDNPGNLPDRPSGSPGTGR